MSKSSVIRMSRKRFAVMRKRFQPRINTCKDQNGNNLQEAPKILNRWLRGYSAEQGRESELTPGYQTAEVLIEEILQWRKYKMHFRDRRMGELRDRIGLLLRFGNVLNQIS